MEKGNQTEVNPNEVYYLSKYPDNDESIASNKPATEINLDVSDSALNVQHETNGSNNTGNFCTRSIGAIYTSITGLLAKNLKLISRIVLIIVLLLYSVYLGYAIYLSPSGAIALIVITAFVLVCLVYAFIRDKFGERINQVVCVPCGRYLSKAWPCLRCFVYICLLAGLIVLLVFNSLNDPSKLISAGGLVLWVILLFVTSKAPHRVNWRPVIWGLTLQFIFGLMVIRWPVGYIAFQFIGSQVETFLAYTDEGSKFVFGDPHYLLHAVAFKILPVIVYFSSVISILYYLGVIQIIIAKIAWLMQFTMGTTAVESLSVAANIFFGQIESSILLRPFLMKLTESELHAVLTGSFATIAGSVVAAFINLKAPPEHVLSAAIMSAPAALAIAKLNYPETEESCLVTQDDVKLEKGNERNIIEAASNGAVCTVKLVAGVVVNVIAFISLLAFLNATLSYLGSKVGYPEVSFEWICSYIFMPIAFLMGVKWEDTGKVGSLIGTKIFLGEFIAYSRLQPLVENNEISTRSVVITTYALCGFGSITAIGINLGALGAMAPLRRSEMASKMLRAMISGNIACIMTACIAGLLYLDGETVGIVTYVNSTEIM